jgi:hypothetical protein
VQHGILVIGEIEIQRVGQDGAGHRAHLKQAQQRPDGTLRGSSAHSLGGEIVDGGQGRGPEQAIKGLRGHPIQ